MRFTKARLADFLEMEISKGYDVIRISEKCNVLYSSEVSGMSGELRHLLIDLITMGDDPQFEIYEIEMRSLIEKLRESEE